MRYENFCLLRIAVSMRLYHAYVFVSPSFRIDAVVVEHVIQGLFFCVCSHSCDIFSMLLGLKRE